MSAVPTSVPLHKVAALNPPLPQRPELDELVSFLPMSAVDAGAIDVVDHDTRRFADVSKGYTPFVADDVLVAKITPCFENGKIAQAKPTHRFAFGSTEFHVVRSDRDALDPRYLAHFLRQDRIRLEGQRKMTGSAGQRRVPEHFLASLQIPLPPLPEQRRIAAVLDQADALRAKRRAALAKLDELTQSIFLDMFGDPVANPRSWPVRKLGSLLTFQQYGPRFYNQSYSEDGVRIVRITDLDESGTLRFSDMPRMSVSAEDKAKYALEAGDVIFARTGATVGKVSLLGPDDPPCIAGAYFIVMRFVRVTVAPGYALALLMAPSIRAIVARRSRQAAQQNFSGPSLRALSMPLPPIELQEEFTRRINAIKCLKTSHDTALGELGTLFASLQQRAFCGAL